MDGSGRLGKIFQIAAERHSTRQALVQTVAFGAMFAGASALGVLPSTSGNIIFWAALCGLLTKCVEGSMIVNGAKTQGGPTAIPEQGATRHLKAAFNVVRDAIRDKASNKSIVPNAIVGGVIGGLLFTPAYEPVAMATSALAFGAFTGAASKAVTGLSNAMDKRYGFVPAYRI
jgi:hypothetical protein